VDSMGQGMSLNSLQLVMSVRGSASRRHSSHMYDFIAQFVCNELHVTVERVCTLQRFPHTRTTRVPSTGNNTCCGFPSILVALRDHRPFAILPLALFAGP
jgi:hypothetical protein